jgi:hypothetical protein
LDLLLTVVTVAGQCFHDSPGITQVDIIDVLLVFPVFSECFQLSPTSRLVPRQHLQAFRK